MEAITPKQKLVFEYIHQFEAEKGFAPSQSEIASHFGFRSLGTVQDYLNRLNRAGLILRPRYGTRAARAAAPGVARPGATPANGDVARTFAGAEADAADAGAKFHATSTASNGDLVLVTVAGGLAVKRLYKQRGRVELHAVESEAPPLVNVDFVIHGVITGVE